MAVRKLLSGLALFLQSDTICLTPVMLFVSSLRVQLFSLVPRFLAVLLHPKVHVIEVANNNYLDIEATHMNCFGGQELFRDRGDPQ